MPGENPQQTVVLAKTTTTPTTRKNTHSDTQNMFMRKPGGHTDCTSGVLS